MLNEKRLSFYGFEKISSSFFLKNLLVLKLVILFFLWGIHLAAYPLDLNVDRLDDDGSALGCVDETPNDCSLRGAISWANTAYATSGEASKINLPAGTYYLTQGADCFFKTLQSGLTTYFNKIPLCIAAPITLQGASADSTIIDANLNGQVFLVSYLGPMELRSVQIRNMTLMHGSQVGPSYLGFGGAINNSGNLMIVDSVVADSRSDVQGGGVYNDNTLTILRSKIIRNWSRHSGGGLYNYSHSQQAVLTISDSSISDNTAQDGHGGGIFNENGLITISGTTLSNNSAAVIGGGIANLSNPPLIGSITLKNSTLSGNHGYSCCGGLFNGFRSNAVLHNVTVANNIGQSIDGKTGWGGGLLNTEGAEMTLKNTVVSGNFAPEYAPDCYSGGRASTIHSLGNNLIQVWNDQCILSGDISGNILNQDAQLGVLSANGGLTQTHALELDSPAIDAGNTCAPIDQRGFLRPFGPRCDIGAFERLGDFALSAIMPTKGGIAGALLAQIFGNGFINGAQVKLKRSGQTDIIGSPTKVDSGGSAILTSFDLAAASAGVWDVEVTNPDGDTKKLPNAFSTEPAKIPELWVEVVVQDVFRAGQTVIYSVYFGNRGNVDAFAVPLSLTIPGKIAPSFLQKITAPPAHPNQVRTDWLDVPVDVSVSAQSTDMNNHVPLVIPVIPAGFVGQFQVRLWSLKI
ncbi:MAG: choice-of-anchor Q domain-containing protein [Nitrosomonas ureae]